MGARSRKRRRVTSAPTTPLPEPPRPRRVRGEERNAQIRAGLPALAPGERPIAIRVAVAVAVLVAITNVVLYAAGYDVPGQKNASAAGAIGVAGLLLIAAFGMWRMKYWAVLGFQCLLAVTAVYAALALLVFSNLQAFVLSLVVMVASGALFWFLVRVLSRIQMPQRPARDA